MKNPQPLENFYPSSRARDGLTSSCKNCKKEYEDAYRLAHKKEIAVRAKIQRNKNPGYHAEWIENNKERHAEIQKKSKQKHKEKINKKGLEYYYKNRERQLALAKKRRDENPEKEKTKGKKFRQENKGTINAKTAARRAQKLLATPKWLDEWQRRENKKFYLKAARTTKEMGVPYHVDHIFPLQGENVSGLHVPWNLRVILGSENESKNNRLKEEDVESHKKEVMALFNETIL